MRKVLQHLGFVPDRKHFEFYQNIGKPEQYPRKAAVAKTVTPNGEPFYKWFFGGWNRHLHGQA